MTTPTAMTNARWSRRGYWVALVIVAMITGVCTARAGSDTNAVDRSLERLATTPLDEMPDLLDELSALQDPRVMPTLQALAEGKLFGSRDPVRILRSEDRQNTTHFVDALTGQPLTDQEASNVKKIPTNNALRTRLKEMVGRLRLSADDPDVRLQAIKTITAAGSEDSIVLLRQRLTVETDLSVRTAITAALALSDLDSDDKTVRLRALGALETVQTQETRSRLQTLLARNADGGFLEPDAEVRTLATRVLNRIERRLQLYAFVETVFFGLSLGSVLVLASIGLAITFGVMGVINMAHGELMMLGAYTTYTVQQLLPQWTDASLFIAVPAAFIVAALVGMAIERGIIQFLYGRPLETLLATFGVSLVLQQAVRSLYSPLNRSVATPAWMSGSWVVNDALSLTYNRLYIVAFSLLVFVLLTQILKRSRLGLEVRAVAQNRNMAKAMGIPTSRVDRLTFGLGSGIAGVAGVALSQLTNVGPNLGQAYIVDTFMVVVFGGVGNLWGTLVGGLTLGIVNKVLEPVAGAVLAKILVLVFIILFIQKRPRGLFPQKGRAAET